MEVKVGQTYTNSEVMDLMEQGYFVEGDKIFTGNTIPPLVFSTDEDGYSSFVMYQDSTLNGCFAKGDRWRLELVDRWEECTDRMVDVIIASMATKGVGSPGDWDHIEVQYIDERRKLMDFLYKQHKGADSGFMLAMLLSDGTWYKKAKR